MKASENNEQLTLPFIFSDENTVAGERVFEPSTENSNSHSKREGVGLDPSSLGDAVAKEQLVANRANEDAKEKKCWVTRMAEMKDCRTIISATTSAGGIDEPDQQGWTPLMAAAQGGYQDFLKCLLNEGADANATNNVGDTALIIAAYEDHYVIVLGLMLSGAEINATNQ